MLGQVATFMENLHLTYPEVLDVVPYRDLLIMSRDKTHVVFGTLVKKVSGKERLAQMRAMRQTKNKNNDGVRDKGEVPRDDGAAQGDGKAHTATHRHR